MLLAQLRRAAQGEVSPERPESPNDAQPIRVFEPATPEKAAEQPADKPSLVKPLEQPKPKKKS